jgi:hypothetical protein
LSGGLPKKETVYVIMPFGKSTDAHTEEYWTGHYESFLKTLIEENPRLQAQRSRALRGDLLTQIISDVVTSPILVADLTDRNPNVFWELGVRHSVKHGTVLVAEEETKLPFDIAGWSTLFYTNDRIRNERFRKLFKEAISDCLNNRERPDSPVAQAISGRGSIFWRFRVEESIRRLDALISELARHVAYTKDAVQLAKRRRRGKSRKFPTYRCRLPATELLVNNRYLEEDQNFYKTLETHYENMIKFNGLLAVWNANPDDVEAYIIDNMSKNTMAETLLDRVKAIHEDLAENL